MADNHLNIEAERAAFEAWAKDKHENLGGEYAGPGKTGWYYWDDETAAAFEKWLAKAARRTPVADGAAVDLPALPPDDELRRIWRVAAKEGSAAWANAECDTTRHGWMMRKVYESVAREAISHYLRKQAGQVGELPTKGEGNAGA